MRPAIPTWRIAPLGFCALAALFLLLGGAALGVLVEAARNPQSALAAFDSYLVRIAGFTLWQAALSTLLSVLPAILVARALSRHPRFFGRATILKLFALPLALPAIVAALGILALYGRAGHVAELAASAGLGRWPGIYGLSGILVAHVFFNLPLATRLLLQALDAVPNDQWRLASQLGMGGRAAFRLIEWPALKAALPGAAGLVFMLCVTSFTLVLTLGGGPGATTLEVAIYQALRFDFDPARALALTLAQIALVGAVLALLHRLGAAGFAEAAPELAARRFLRPGGLETGANALVVALALAFVAGPLVAVAVSGLEADLARLATERAVLTATGTSLALAAVSALLATGLALSLARGRRRLELARGRQAAGLPERLMDSGVLLVLAAPPILIGAGWFILLRHAGDVLALAPVMVATVNAAMALPFVLRVLRPAHDAASMRHDRLCAQLGVAGFDRLRLVDWPALKGPLSTGFAFAMALSLGDLGVIALFGSDSVQTLPYLLLGRMGSYRTEDAAGLALLLGLVCLALMVLADRGKGPGKELRA